MFLPSEAVYAELHANFPTWCSNPIGPRLDRLAHT